MVFYVKNKEFKTIWNSAGNQCYQRKVAPQVNLVIPPVVNRLISVLELRAVAIKNIWLNYYWSMNFFATFFLREKPVIVIYSSAILGTVTQECLV